MSRGGLFAVIGGIVAIIGFFALPYISVGLLGSYTGAQLAGAFASESGSGGTVALFMYLIPVLGLIGAILGGRIMSRANGLDGKPVRGLAIANIIVGLVGAALLILPLVTNNSSSNQYGFNATQIVMSFIGFGYWVSLLSMAAILIGGISAITAKE